MFKHVQIMILAASFLVHSDPSLDAQLWWIIKGLPWNCSPTGKNQRSYESNFEWSHFSLSLSQPRIIFSSVPKGFGQCEAGKDGDTWHCQKLNVDFSMHTRDPIFSNYLKGDQLLRMLRYFILFRPIPVYFHVSPNSAISHFESQLRQPSSAPCFFACLR